MREESKSCNRNVRPDNPPPNSLGFPQSPILGREARHRKTAGASLVLLVRAAGGTDVRRPASVRVQMCGRRDSGCVC